MGYKYRVYGEMCRTWRARAAWLLVALTMPDLERDGVEVLEIIAIFRGTCCQ